MPSLTVENYLKAIFLLAEEGDGSPVATGVIATSLAVSPGTVTRSRPPRAPLPTPLAGR